MANSSGAEIVKRPLSPRREMDVLVAKLAAGVREFTGHHVRNRYGYMESWVEARDKPAFVPKVEPDSSGIVHFSVEMVGEEAESASLTVWDLLDMGTQVRYMQTSADWRSKTQPGFDFSGPGRGFTTGIDIFAPQPGIEARHQEDMISDALEPELFVITEEALNSWLR